MSDYPGLPQLVAGVTLDTARLRLRLYRESDLDVFADMHGDPVTMQYIGEGKALTRAETWRFLAAGLGHWALRGYGMFAVTHRETGEVLGRCGFYHPDGWPGFEIGWLFHRKHWGRGYATEAAAAALDHAFNSLNQTHVVSFIRRDNLASVRVAEKIGETYEKEIELLGAPALVYGIHKP
ncbi:MAG: GNAT family N-acetyltransferase [Burkholderiales bacterium]|nr:GNAT family N-acetyltransferase [Burkholderiales bacterium]